MEIDYSAFLSVPCWAPLPQHSYAIVSAKGRTLKLCQDLPTPIFNLYWAYALRPAFEREDNRQPLEQLPAPARDVVFMLLKLQRRIYPEEGNVFWTLPALMCYHTPEKFLEQHHAQLSRLMQLPQDWGNVFVNE